jgi:hypothetical protein
VALPWSAAGAAVRLHPDTMVADHHGLHASATWQLGPCCRNGVLRTELYWTELELSVKCLRWVYIRTSSLRHARIDVQVQGRALSSACARM